MTFGLISWRTRKLAFLLILGVAASLMEAQAQQFSSSATAGESVDAASAVSLHGSYILNAEAPAANRFRMQSASLPVEYGAIVQGGLGLTEDRDGFKFIMAGVHAGKVLYNHDKPGLLRGNFEYAMELFPYWQSYTPKFERAKCVAGPLLGGITCSPYYTVGGTFSGVTVTPIILRWNFAGKGRIVPWAQAAGGLLWTNHKYPAFGSPTLNLTNDGPNTDASVWNFTPQGGVGLHYFLSPTRSIDLGANAIHISSASLGDKNPGVNASVQFSLGYTFWK